MKAQAQQGLLFVARRGAMTPLARDLEKCHSEELLLPICLEQQICSPFQ